MTAKRLKSSHRRQDRPVSAREARDGAAMGRSETESLRGRGDENRRNPGPGTGRQGSSRGGSELRAAGSALGDSLAFLCVVGWGSDSSHLGRSVPSLCLVLNSGLLSAGQHSVFGRRR